MNQLSHITLLPWQLSATQVLYFKIKTSDTNKEQCFTAQVTAFSSSMAMSSAMAINEYDYIIRCEKKIFSM